ncbi:MAG TPA: UDP-N-acetylmuramate dehydrogenase [Usitatibacter sp.]|nr:UDP-N-acetylmuramate dehydrogenase [Usitatibacter sp.]
MSERAHIPPVLRGEMRLDEPMSRHVSWRAGGRAKVFYQPADVLDLGEFLRSRPADEPILFVGLGSNLLVRDGGFAGAVVFTHHALIGIEVESEVATPQGMLAFRAGCGVPSPHLARFAAKHGAAGAEWMAGVPGTVGGALAMNAGCYGGETWNHVVSVETIDRAGTLRHREPSDYEVGYRHVRLKRAAQEWFVSGVFGFQPGEETAAMRHIKELLQKRVASQPLNLPNAGSVFRNPPGDHAARLIDAAGLKGYTVGGAQVSAKHANFIVNVAHASAADVEAVIDHVHATVLAGTGVDLVREVRIVGERA